MIGGWQGDYDNLTLRKSFYEIDFAKLTNIYVPKEIEFYLEKSINSTGSFKAETKKLLGKSLRLLRKHFLPEVMLLENKHIINFFNNVIKFTQIEHLYLLSTPDAELSVQISPLIFCSVQRFATLVKDAHLMYSFSHQQEGLEFKGIKDLLVHLMDRFKIDFSKLIASYQKSPTKDPSNLVILENLLQLNTYLIHFEKIRSHKEYLRACLEEHTQPSQDGMTSVTDFSPVKSLSKAGERLPTNFSQKATSIIEEASFEASSQASTESNSIRSFMREKKSNMGKASGFGYSRISNPSLMNSLNSSFSSSSGRVGGYLSELSKSQQDDTGNGGIVNHIKNTDMYAGLLSSLKQNNELRGLKFIHEKPIFSKVEDEQLTKKESTMKERFFPVKEEDEKINPFHIIEVRELKDREVEVKITEEQKARRRQAEEDRIKEEALKKQNEEKARLHARLEKKKKQMVIYEEEEDEKSQDKDSDEDDFELINRQRQRTLTRRDIRRKKGGNNEEIDKSLNETSQYIESLNLSPINKTGSSNAFGFNGGLLRLETLEYQRPTIDYLEKMERVYEKPSDYGEEEIGNYCFNKGSGSTGRREFLTNLFGERVYDKLYRELNDSYSSSALKTGTNQELKVDLLRKMNQNLENKKIKRFAKLTSTQESLFYFFKQRKEILNEEEECDEEARKRAQHYWQIIRNGLQMKKFMKKLSNKEISVSFVNLNNNKVKKFLEYFDRDLEKHIISIKVGNDPKAQSEWVGRLFKKREVEHTSYPYQGVFVSRDIVEKVEK